MNKEYYLLEGEEKTGPFTYNELIEKGIDIHTQLSSPLKEEWQYASELPEFNNYFESKGVYFPTEDNLATFGWRALAFIMDYIPLYLLVENIEVQMGWISIPSDYTWGKPIPPSLMTLYVSFVAVLLLYRTICEATSLKGTLGKKACKLIVVDINGQRLSILQSLGRNVGVLLSVTLWVPFLSMLLNEHKQNWYDSLAKTYVLKTNQN
jgi:uncharacterized RDD family membrane protein YckC